MGQVHALSSKPKIRALQQIEGRPTAGTEATEAVGTIYLGLAKQRDREDYHSKQNNLVFGTIE